MTPLDPDQTSRHFRPPTQRLIDDDSQTLLSPPPSFAFLTPPEFVAALEPTTPPMPQAQLAELAALSAGDLVVHIEHGIGRYEGLQAIPVGQSLHVPVLPSGPRSANVVAPAGSSNGQYATRSGSPRAA